MGVAFSTHSSKKVYNPPFFALDNTGGEIIRPEDCHGILTGKEWGMGEERYRDGRMQEREKGSGVHTYRSIEIYDPTFFAFDNTRGKIVRPEDCYRIL